MRTSIGNNVNFACQLLKAGQVVAIPTETVYGLAANVYDEQAICRIFTIKHRPMSHPLIVHLHNQEQLMHCISELPASAALLTKRFWPGPLTLLLKKRSTFPNWVTANQERVAVRMPNHPLALRILSHLPFPLAAPSANPFGYVSPTTAQHVYHQLAAAIPYIVDGGPCNIGLESTIIGFEAESVMVYRLGGIPLEAIEATIGDTVHFAPTLIAEKSNKTLLDLHATIPGGLAHHYAPKKPLLMGDIMQLINQHRGKRIGILSFDRYYAGISRDYQVVLSPQANIQEAAHNLFSGLRILDQLPIDCIIANYLPQYGLGASINDRLFRASK